MTYELTQMHYQDILTHSSDMLVFKLIVGQFYPFLNVTCECHVTQIGQKPLITA